MIGAVHASIGAAVGSFFKRKSTAFVAGVASHLVADMLPHDDFDPKVEAPLLAATLGAIAVWKGLDSPEFAGAIGGMAPDIEHAFLVGGLISPEDEFFPTHLDDGKHHGPASGERLSQLLLVAASLLTLALKGDGGREPAAGR